MEGIEVKQNEQHKNNYVRWTIARFFNEDVLMDNGALSAITVEEIAAMLNELEVLRVKKYNPQSYGI